VSQTSWRKSSYSNGEGSSCVEVAWGSHQVLVRDSKNPSGPMLTVPAVAWSQLISLGS
jgi:hypothetical protein